jgi:hypothetical protein
MLVSDWEPVPIRTVRGGSYLFGEKWRFSRNVRPLFRPPPLVGEVTPVAVGAGVPFP